MLCRVLSSQDDDFKETRKIFVGFIIHSRCFLLCLSHFRCCHIISSNYCFSGHHKKKVKLDKCVIQIIKTRLYFRNVLHYFPLLFLNGWKQMWFLYHELCHEHCSTDDIYFIIYWLTQQTSTCIIYSLTLQSYQLLFIRQ